MTNKEIKRIQSLKRGKCRREHGQFLIEGKRLVQSAFERKIKPDLIYFTEPFQRENTEWIQSIEWSGVSYENISTKQLEKISFTKSPSGILAVCKFPEQHLPDLNQNRFFKSFPAQNLFLRTFLQHIKSIPAFLQLLG